MSGIKFSPGSIVATPGALAALEASGDDPMAYLVRHLAGDWGDVDEHDRRENELSLIHGFRLLSTLGLYTHAINKDKLVAQNQVMEAMRKPRLVN